MTTKNYPSNEIGISVYSGRIARELLRKGYKIVDIKPNVANKQISVFIFAIEGEISKDIEALIQRK